MEPIIVGAMILIGFFLVSMWSAMELSGKLSREEHPEGKDFDYIQHYSPVLSPNVTFQDLKKYGFKCTNKKWYYTKYISHDDTVTFDVMVDLRENAVDIAVFDELTCDDFLYTDRIRKASSGNCSVPEELKYVENNVVNELCKLNDAGILVGYHRGDII